MIWYYAATTINIVNSCTEALNVCKTDSTGALACFDNLSASGGSHSLDVGSTWTGGVIWAYPAKEGSGTTTGNNAKPQANLAEFTINASGEDYYDISNVVRCPNMYLITSTCQTTCPVFIESTLHFSLYSSHILPGGRYTWTWWNCTFYPRREHIFPS